MTHNSLYIISAFLVKIICTVPAPGEFKSFAPAYSPDKAVGDWNNKNSYESDKANNKNAQAYNSDRAIDDWNNKGAYQSDMKHVRGQPRNSTYNDIDDFELKKQSAYSGNNVKNFKNQGNYWKPLIQHFLQEKSSFDYHEQTVDSRSAYTPDYKKLHFGSVSQRNKKPRYNSNIRNQNTYQQRGYKSNKNNKTLRDSPRPAYSSKSFKKSVY